MQGRGQPRRPRNSIVSSTCKLNAHASERAPRPTRKAAQAARPNRAVAASQHAEGSELWRCTHSNNCTQLGCQWARLQGLGTEMGYMCTKCACNPLRSPCKPPAQDRRAHFMPTPIHSQQVCGPSHRSRATKPGRRAQRRSSAHCHGVG